MIGLLIKPCVISPTVPAPPDGPNDNPPSICPVLGLWT